MGSPVRSLNTQLVCAFTAIVAASPIARAQTSRAPTVIESATPQWTAASAWKVDPKPILTLGDADPVFSSIASAHRYADGRIVVADEKAKELLLFDATDAFLRKIARPGSGPGEFQALGQMFSAGGDSIAVWDRRTRRLTYFGDRGQFLRSNAAATGTPVAGGRMTVFPSPLGRFADGSLLAEQNRGTKRAETSKMIVDSTTYVLMGAATNKSIGDFFARETWDFWHTNGDVSFGDSPFARVGAVVVGPQSFFVSNGAQYEVTEYDKAGVPLRVMRIRRNLTLVTSAQLAQYKRDFHETSKEHDADVVKWITIPKTLPTFNQLVRDTDGRIWARNYNVNPSFTRYDVFDTTGRWLGSIGFPNNSTLLEAGKDWVLLRVFSADGEPLVELHRLIRPQ